MTAIAPSTLAPLNPPPLERSPLLNLLIVDDDSLVREACREAAAALHLARRQSSRVIR